MNSICSGRMTARASAGSRRRETVAASWPMSRPACDQAVGQAAGDEGVPVIDRRRVDLTIEDAAPAVDETARVAIGAWVADRRR